MVIDIYFKEYKERCVEQCFFRSFSKIRFTEEAQTDIHMSTLGETHSILKNYLDLKKTKKKAVLY